MACTRLLRIAESAADDHGVDLSYRVRDLVAGKPFWKPSALRNPAWFVQLAAFALMSACLWRESGPFVAVATVAAVPPFMVAVYMRAMTLEVVADTEGISVTNWFAKHRWRWDEIASIDYRAGRGIIRLHRGYVVLHSGKIYVLAAVVGSSTGRLDRDLAPRTFVHQLCAEVATRSGSPPGSRIPSPLG
jgi:hypothetical protein